MSRSVLLTAVLFGVFAVVLPHPALAAGAAGTGGWVSWVLATKGQVALLLGAICFFAAVFAIGDIAINRGHINGAAWTSIGVFFACGLLLATDQIIAAVQSA
jgi:hypothetical protein